jgi:hypothetical protein
MRNEAEDECVMMNLSGGATKKAVDRT